MKRHLCQYISILFISICFLGYDIYEVDAQCSGTPVVIDVGSQSGTFSFPFSGEYGTNLNCEWHLRSSVNATILYQISDIGIDCSDVLRVSDGRNIDLCTRGSTFSHPLAVTNGQSFSLKFSSDGTSSAGKDMGFSVSYISSPDFSFCSSPGQSIELKASTSMQVITSPKFPNFYENNWKCEWTISPSSDAYYVTLDVHFMDIDQFNGRCFDHLKIYNHTAEWDDICGIVDFSPAKTYVGSPASNISITFTSDDVQQERGFVAIYTQSLTTAKPKLTTIEVSTAKTVLTTSEVTDAKDDSTTELEATTTSKKKLTTLEDVATTREDSTIKQEDHTVIDIRTIPSISTTSNNIGMSSLMPTTDIQETLAFTRTSHRKHSTHSSSTASVTEINTQRIDFDAYTTLKRSSEVYINGPVISSDAGTKRQQNVDSYTKTTGSSHGISDTMLISLISIIVVLLIIAFVTVACYLCRKKRDKYTFSNKKYDVAGKPDEKRTDNSCNKDCAVEMSALTTDTPND